VAVGERVPSYSGAGPGRADGGPARLRGEVVLLNVWATWCFPCRREMPAFEQLHRELVRQSGCGSSP
jgi:thiol-disulfide isomerase/thioredoxin